MTNRLPNPEQRKDAPKPSVYHSIEGAHVVADAFNQVFTGQFESLHVSVSPVNNPEEFNVLELKPLKGTGKSSADIQSIVCVDAGGEYWTVTLATTEAAQEIIPHASLHKVKIDDLL